jgi:hypothetical protein
MQTRVGAVVAVCAATAACVNSADSKRADAAMDQFFAQLSAKQYQAIYDGAAPEFRSATDQATLVGMLQRIDRKLGACKPAQKSGAWSAYAGTNGYKETLGFSQACGNGALGWSVTVIVRRNQAQLLAFNATSPLLLTD